MTSSSHDIRRFAIMLRMRNTTLSIARSELIAEVCHRTFNAIFLTQYFSPHSEARSNTEISSTRSFSSCLRTTYELMTRQLTPLKLTTSGVTS
ncbi:MAG: hypothetical protein AAFO84_06830 [Cyanobacteria bacterium J06598_1]